MSRSLLPIGLLGACLLALSACDKPAEKTPDQPTAAAATTPSAATEQASADTDSMDIPTESDFEDEAEQTISTANLETQLDALEKEIGE